MKRNKIRYQSKSKEKVLLTLTGNMYLQYREDEAIEQAVAGDIMAYPRCDSLHTMRQGEYEGTGFSGYFKIDVYDGKQWCLVLTQEIFPHQEHQFAKSERPIDTYRLCESIIKSLAGRALVRTYREHYMLDED